MNILKITVRALLVCAAWALTATAGAQGAKSQPDGAAKAGVVGIGSQYSSKGADTCLDCHDPDSDTETFKTNGIFKGGHGSRVDKRSPFGPGGLQCEACHGPGANHGDKKGSGPVTTSSFKRDSFVPVRERNQVCLNCHQTQARTGWHAGAHDRNEVACADCHTLHTGRDPVMNKATQPEVCYACHKQQRADLHKPSTHPVKAGRMACSDCHNAHGSSSPASLVKPTLNQTCYSCHADKRGPMLWQHAPVAEDCGTCHASHGSVRAGLLTKSTPQLCQQCHSSAGHPAVARTGAALPGGTAQAGQAFLLADSCMNCHSQVHGSNHPSGSKLMR